jgi:hypothetical protein
MQSRRQTNRATNRIVCPSVSTPTLSLRRQRRRATVDFVKQHGRGTESLRASSVPSNESGLQDNAKRSRPTETDRLPSVSTPTVTGRRRRRRWTSIKNSTVECRLKAFVPSVPSCESGCKSDKAEDRPTATNRIVCPRYRRCHSGGKGDGGGDGGTSVNAR